MEQNWTALARAIKQRRLELGLTRTDLARRAEVSRQTVHNFESGEGFVRLPPTLSKIAEALGWAPEMPYGVLEGRIAVEPAFEAPSLLGEDEIRQVVTGAMVAATDVGAAEIREVVRLVVNDLRARKVLPPAPEVEEEF